jgi:hypothetical protein
MKKRIDYYSVMNKCLNFSFKMYLYSMSDSVSKMVTLSEKSMKQKRVEKK